MLRIRKRDIRIWTRRSCCAFSPFVEL